MKQATVVELEASGADPFDALLTLEDHFLASGFAAGAQASQSQPDVPAAYGDLSTRAQASCMVVKWVKRPAASSDTRRATSSALNLDSTEDASTRYLPFQLRTQVLHPHGAASADSWKTRLTRLARRRHGSYSAPRVAVSRRILATLTRLHTLLGTIQLDDPLDQRCFDALDDVRARMRMVDVWLKGRSKAGSDADADGGAASAGAAAGGGDLNAVPSTPSESTVELSF